jgi:hypothetical protein
MSCRKCGNGLPPQLGPGRRRTMCETCSPRDKRERHKPARVTSLPSAAGSLAATVVDRLTEAGREDTIDGRAAIAAALVLDSGEHSAAGRAALQREMRTAAADALRGASAGQDLVDELRARRARRLG